MTCCRCCIWRNSCTLLWLLVTCVDLGLLPASPTPAGGAPPARPRTFKASAFSAVRQGPCTPTRVVLHFPLPAGRACRWGPPSSPQRPSIFRGSGGGLYGSGWGLLCPVCRGRPPQLPLDHSCTLVSASLVSSAAGLLLSLGALSWWPRPLAPLPGPVTLPPPPVYLPPRCRPLHSGLQRGGRPLCNGVAAVLHFVDYINWPFS